MSDRPWIAKIERRVTRWARSGPGPAWVIAVSGGSDSVGLLRVLHEVAPRAGMTLSVAHLDHGARGEAARLDAAFAADLARSLGLPFDLGHWTPTRPGHFESDARRARYAWLAEVARARGASAVAVGHTRDDQAETVLHRVIRGTGVRGLAGIPARRSLGEGLTLVRPLLTVSRREVRDHLDGLGQDYRDDATNADTSRTRARLRHDLLPRLAADYNPKVADALVRLARLAAASDRADRERILEMERFAARGGLGADPDAVAFDRDRLMQFPAFLRTEVLRLAWRRAGWPEAGMSAKRWRRLGLLVGREREGRWDVGGGVVAETASMPNTPEGSQIPALTFTLRRSDAPQGYRPYRPVGPETLPLLIPGSAPWPDGRVVLTDDPGAPRDETIDVDRLCPPLWVRAPLPGDRFNPLGMGDRAQPLNDFFRGRRVSRERRALTPLVCDRLGIVWVVGHRIADRVRLTDSTTRRAGLRWDHDVPRDEPPGPADVRR